MTVPPAREPLRHQIRAARQHRGLTQIQLGDLANIGPGRISELETGRVGIGMITLLRLAAALGYDLALIPWEDTP